MSYSELSVEERATIQIGHAQGFSLRGIACLINRSPSTISRELRRNRDACGGYSARVAQQQMQARRQVCRPKQKLLPGSERFELVAHMLRERLSPEQIAGKLRSMNIPSLRDAYVCRETIYNAIYGIRSMNPTFHQMGLRFTVAFLASSSTAAAPRSPLPTRHAATAPVRGAATYRAPGRWPSRSRPGCRSAHWQSHLWACH